MHRLEQDMIDAANLRAAPAADRARRFPVVLALGLTACGADAGVQHCGYAQNPLNYRVCDAETRSG